MQTNDLGQVAMLERELEKRFEKRCAEEQRLLHLRQLIPKSGLKILMMQLFGC